VKDGRFDGGGCGVVEVRLNYPSFVSMTSGATQWKSD
jgi:hypothetical protein